MAAQKPVEMLKAEEYPAEKWKFLLRLMNLFELSFPLSEDGQRQICPTLNIVMIDFADLTKGQAIYDLNTAADQQLVSAYQKWKNAHL